MDMDDLSLNISSTSVSNDNEEEKVIVRKTKAIHIDDKCIHRSTRSESQSSKQVMKEEDRRAFIDFLFQELETIKKMSKKQIAKTISDKYKEEHPNLKLNEVWVYRLLLGGIYRNDDGQYGFDKIDCDFDEMLSKPSILEKALKNKK